MNITKEFEQNLFNFLSNLNETPDNYDSWRNGLKGAELHDVIEFAIEHDFVQGITSELNAHREQVTSLSNPRLTNEGLIFIRDFE